jgi:hypothetical protein
MDMNWVEMLADLKAGWKAVLKAVELAGLWVGVLVDA